MLRRGVEQADENVELARKGGLYNEEENFFYGDLSDGVCDCPLFGFGNISRG